MVYDKRIERVRWQGRREGDELGIVIIFTYNTRPLTNVPAGLHLVC
jgi:hypothetical protein